MNGFRKDERRPVTNYSNRENPWNKAQGSRGQGMQNRRSNQHRGCPTRLVYSNLKTDIRWID